MWILEKRWVAGKEPALGAEKRQAGGGPQTGHNSHPHACWQEVQQDTLRADLGAGTPEQACRWVISGDGGQTLAWTGERMLFQDGEVRGNRGVTAWGRALHSFVDSWIHLHPLTYRVLSVYLRV